jgi:ABC-type multidrug transport system ATPase subunit
MDEAEHCHRLALINQGELKAIGSPRELKESIKAAGPEGTQASLEDVFVALTREASP